MVDTLKGKVMKNISWLASHLQRMTASVGPQTYTLISAAANWLPESQVSSFTRRPPRVTLMWLKRGIRRDVGENLAVQHTRR